MNVMVEGEKLLKNGNLSPNKNNGLYNTDTINSNYFSCRLQ